MALQIRSKTSTVGDRRFRSTMLTKGKVQNKGLGCSGYATAVLYRMLNGKKWKEKYKEDWDDGHRPHQRSTRPTNGFSSRHATP